MSTTLTPIITEQGLQRAFRADSDGVAICISHIAAGNGHNGKGYAVAVAEDGHATQTSLFGEQQRLPIADGKQGGSPHQIDMSFIVDDSNWPAALDGYWVTELGFYLDDGTLFAVWSDPERALAWKEKGVDLLIGLELALTTLPAESVTIVSSGAKLELVISKEMATLGEAIVNLQHRQLTQNDAITTQQQTHHSYQSTTDARLAKLEALLASLAEESVPQLQLGMNNAAPAGAVLAFAMDDPPTGWLECDGSALRRSNYGALFAAIGTTYGAGDGSTTFNLPDLRGEFVRGWDHGKNIDSGRTIGSAQNPTAIRHLIDNYPNYPVGTLCVGAWETESSDTNPTGNRLGTLHNYRYYRASTSEIAGSGDNLSFTTRPRNIALMYCIKY